MKKKEVNPVTETKVEEVETPPETAPETKLEEVETPPETLTETKIEEVETPDQENATAPGCPKAIVLCSKLNIRHRPTKESAVLLVIKKDDIVELTSETVKGWIRVFVSDANNDEGVSGFVMGEFIKEV